MATIVAPAFATAAPFSGRGSDPAVATTAPAPAPVPRRFIRWFGVLNDKEERHRGANLVARDDDHWQAVRIGLPAVGRLRQRAADDGGDGETQAPGKWHQRERFGAVRIVGDLGHVALGHADVSVDHALAEAQYEGHRHVDAEAKEQAGDGGAANAPKERTLSAVVVGAAAPAEGE
eukprot:CAMPEP_0119536114 /NCGR_PEP_ID=MMETSP1344-20130328/49024_1 /TAXON_ID=236787 /ORGANISM="Florenciella parvula, Strain CCMP2471" /LENGTH=175 /DNA_ID=CAMNT_0007578029 /DNA_START=128 /DNA_END=655 /DNA_ORIENTATION=+